MRLAEVILIPDSTTSSESALRWPSIPASDPRCGFLREKFGVTAVPELVVLNTNGKLLERHGAQELREEGPNFLRHLGKVGGPAEAGTRMPLHTTTQSLSMTMRDM